MKARILAGVVVTAAAAAAGLLTWPQAPAGEPESTPPASMSFNMLQGADLATIDLSVRLIRNRCMATAGYPQNLEHMSTRPQNPLSPILASARGFEPESEQAARQNGFGWDVAAQPARIVSFNPEYDSALERCTNTAWRFLGGEAALRNYYDYGVLVNAIVMPFSEEVERRIPGDVPAKMYDCMSGRGYEAADRETFLTRPDPRTSFGVPLGTLNQPPDTWRPARISGTVQVGPATPARHYLPTGAESELAVAWFRCSVETGRHQHYRVASEQAQHHLMTSHSAELAELGPMVDDLARRADRLLNTLE
jgi:hypothetical protein